jgi:uncharacterized membrane protein
MEPEKEVTIFIVDDNKVFALALKGSIEEAFKNKSITIHLFETGEKCMEKFSEVIPDIVILDYHLNSEFADAANGLHVLDKIKKSSFSTSVIMLTSNDHIDVALKSFHHGASDYVLKTDTQFQKINHSLSNIFANKELAFLNEKKIDKLISDDNQYINKLHQIVKDTLEAEDLIVYNLLNPPLETLSSGQKISDKVARFGGSWKFIIAFGILLTLWIIFNVIAIGHFKFDPYPFILMNLILSCIAALQAPIIMMSQNRGEEKDRMRSENDYMINLKSEMQIRSLQQKMDLLLEEQIMTLFATQERQFTLLKEINRKLDTHLTNNT